MVSSIESQNELMTQMLQQMRQQMQQQVQAANTDGVEGLSQDELGVLSENIKSSTGKNQTSFIDALIENFDKYDTNQDGQLTSSEVKNANEELSSQNSGKTKAHGGGGGGDALSADSSEDSNEIVYAMPGDDVSPVKIDDTGKITLRTVIQLGMDSLGLSNSQNPLTSVLNAGTFSL